jgi:hypothetical protein
MNEYTIRITDSAGNTQTIGGFASYQAAAEASDQPDVAHYQITDSEGVVCHTDHDDEAEAELASGKKVYEYTIRTEAGMCTYDAANINEAVKLFAADTYPGGLYQAETADELVAKVEAEDNVDGCWLWIESDEAPDGDRRWANEENMP